VIVVAPFVLLGILLACCAYPLIRRRRRRRAASLMYVLTYPGIELDQRYGGWDADAYDAWTERGRPRLASAVRLSDPPSSWGWLP
jgi:hypothetical protein